MEADPNLNVSRYHRQELLPRIGAAGQARLGRARVVLVGCGALGTVLAEQLVRAGVGRVRVVDRDVVELTNLQRQVLFDEADAREGLPKAVAAARRLAAVNSAVHVEPVVADFHAGNAEALAGLQGDGPGDAGTDGDPRPGLLLDGTDNVQTRYLLNDLAVKHGVPWVYGACVGTEGRVMAVRPTESACLRCLFPQPPGPGELPTCDTAGVLGPVAAVVASFQAVAAIKLLSGNEAAVGRRMLVLDAWGDRLRWVDTSDARRPDCPACARRQFDFLDSPSDGRTVSLCGRNAFQVRPGLRASSIDLASLERRLHGVGHVERTPHLLRVRLSDPPDVHVTVFPDGRAIIGGVNEAERARSLYARYVGT